ncbi:MAG: cobyric acid synthase [Thermodesulfobacteriota bacterium]
MEMLKKARCLAVLGTGSDVGKSMVAAALCRVLSDRGVRVAPFKAQNLSNNSGVTPEGLEMGRAQMVQARAARVAPHVDMNPVLLKPAGLAAGCQVVLLGRPLAPGNAGALFGKREALFREAARALDRLRDRHDMVIMEGAGSCAEVNLKSRDIVNFSMAAYADAPVLLVADIDRGGVFAQIVGTLACLEREERDRIAGFVINRFQGESSLFADGVAWIEEKTGRKVFGVLPHLPGLGIEEEDAVAIEGPEPELEPRGPAVAVIRTPCISNFTDFDALQAVPGLSVLYLQRPRDLGRFAAVILPGSKNTRGDLAWLVSTGWTEMILRYAEGGGHVLGLCGGFQMLGQAVRDPRGVEGAPGESPGLGLLPVVTVMAGEKTTTLTDFSWDRERGRGYEIHMGETSMDGGSPWFSVNARNNGPSEGLEGCVSPGGRIRGTYLHGLFDSPGILTLWLCTIGLEGLSAPADGGPAGQERRLDAWAAHFKKHVDVHALFSSCGIPFA